MVREGENEPGDGQGLASEVESAINIKGDATAGPEADADSPVLTKAVYTYISHGNWIHH